MKLGGIWVGLGLGDVDPEIVRLKSFLRQKFSSYASQLNYTDVFDDELLAVVVEMQDRYHAQGRLHAPNGIMDFDTKVVSGFHKPPPVRLPPLLCAQGTGVPMDFGPPADIGRAVADQWFFQPVGHWPAAAFPMNPSVQQGRAEVNRLIDASPGPFALCGYSQGAIVMAEVWEYDIKPIDGRLNHRIDDIQKMVLIGNPMRERGNGIGTPGGEAPSPESEGIADRLMVDTPDFCLNLAHKGDLYTDCEGESGENKRAIYKIVMGTRIFSGPDSLLSQVLEVLGVRKDASRLVEIMGIFRSIMDAGLFAIRRTGPHISYQLQPAIDHLRS